MYFTSVNEGKTDLRVVRRRPKAKGWPAISEAIDNSISNKGETRGAFSTQGRYPLFLFFAAKDAEGKNYDFFVAIKHGPDKVWAAPTPVMGEVNTKEDECFPWLADEGKSLYFSRKTKAGWRLWVSKRTNTSGPQGWGEPKEAGLPVGFHHATFTPDSKTMILQGPLEKGRWGLFRCKKTASGWGKPQALVELNHPGGKIGDRSPNLSRDGNYLYFASDRPKGKGGLDLYAVLMADLKK
jgi:hypothetical protein